MIIGDISRILWMKKRDMERHREREGERIKKKSKGRIVFTEILSFNILYYDQFYIQPKIVKTTTAREFTNCVWFA